MSPSLEVCGDVLDRVHYQMAEANARPVLPASAKAVSMVAASAANQSAAVGPNKTNQMQAIECGPSSSIGQTKQSSSVVSNSEGVESKRNQQQQQQQQKKPSNRASSIADGSSSSSSALGSVTSLLSSSNQQQHQQPPMGPKSPPPSQSSIASSFVSSESITSNLRKMIVSSSATIGRKLNISSSSSLSSQNSTNNNNINSQQQPVRNQGQQILTTNKTTPTPETTIGITTASIGSSGKQHSEVSGAGSKSDFETRQANYKHPVIQSDLRPKSAGCSRFRQASSDTSFLRQDDNSSELNQQQQLSKDTEGNSQSGCNQTLFNQQTSQLSRLAQPGEGVIKR